MSGEEFLRIAGTTSGENVYEYSNNTPVAEASGEFEVSVFTEEQAQKKNSSNKKTTTQPQKTTTAEKLHSDWQPVLEAESKVKQSKIKCDPNISQNFFVEVENTAKNLNCKAEDLAAIIYRESHFDPAVKDSTKKYTGLIQMDKEAFDSIPGKKCTYAQYCKLPREKQIKYSEKYLQMRIDEKGLKGKKLTGGQLYTLIWRPRDINKPQIVNQAQEKVNKAKKVPEKFKTQDKSAKSKGKKLNVKM